MLKRRLRRSGLDGGQGAAVCKTVGSAYVGSNPTPATHFRRSKPVTPDGVTGFRVPGERFRRPSVKACGPAGPDQITGCCSDLVLIFTFNRINDCRQGCCFGVCPFGVGVVHGPSAGRAGKPRTHSGRRPRPPRGRCNRWLSTDGHGPHPAGSPRTWPCQSAGNLGVDPVRRGDSGCGADKGRPLVPGAVRLC